jgi:hypothetical protein
MAELNPGTRPHRVEVVVSCTAQSRAADDFTLVASALRSRLVRDLCLPKTGTDRA